MVECCFDNAQITHATFFVVVRLNVRETDVKHYSTLVFAELNDSIKFK